MTPSVTGDHGAEYVVIVRLTAGTFSDYRTLGGALCVAGAAIESCQAARARQVLFTCEAVKAPITS